MINFLENLDNPHLDLSLFLLDKELQGLGKQLQDYHLSLPTYDWNQSFSNPVLADQLNYNTQEEETLLAD